MAPFERVLKFDYFYAGPQVMGDYELDLAESGVLNFRCVSDGTSSGWHYGWTGTQEDPLEITCKFHYKGEREPCLNTVTFRAKRNDTFAATNFYPVVMILKEVLTGVDTAPPSTGASAAGPFQSAATPSAATSGTTIADDRVGGTVDGNPDGNGGGLAVFLKGLGLGCFFFVYGVASTPMNREVLLALLYYYYRLGQNQRELCI